MSAFLAQALAAFIQAILQYLEHWKEQQDAEAAQWAAQTRAGQMASEKDATRVEQVIVARERAIVAPMTPAAWNAIGRATVLGLCCLMLGGCFTRYVYVPSKQPIIARPERPILDETVPFTPREFALAAYATGLEQAIYEYNHQAADANARNGY